MSLLALSVDDLLTKTAAAEAEPGGGGAAILSGILGIGLIVMALKVTDKGAHQERIAEAEAAMARLRELPDRDVEAFSGVLDALKLPKEPAGERRAALRKASGEAAALPAGAARDLLEALQGLRDAPELASRQVVSDVGAGAALVLGAVEALLLTAAANYRLMREDAEAARTQHGEVATRTRELAAAMLAQTRQRL